MSLPPPERPRVPTITVGLRPHPGTRVLEAASDTSPARVSAIGMLLATMYAAPDGTAVFEFKLEDTVLDGLRIPPPARPGAADELWKHTCFEVFLGAPGEPGYREYNFSPSGQWAIYGFHTWRERIEDYAPAAKPEILFAPEDDGLVLEARVPAELLPVVPAGSDLQVSLAAVIERKDGRFEHWALRHVAAHPDCHARETFVLTLATATHKAD